MPAQGVKTGEFGRWLTRYVEVLETYRGFHVYYDHGDRKVEANVVATKGFFGKSVSNLNRLADVDVALIDPGGKLRLLFEIEERPCSPKKLLGNILANLICNRYAVRAPRGQQYFDLDPTTRLVIAGFDESKRDRLRKIETVILPRVRNLLGLSDGINPANVDLVFTTTIDATITALQQLVERSFPK